MYRYGQEEIDAVARVINSRALFKINGAGREVMNFQEEIQKKFGVAHAILMTSGQAAIVTALTALGIGPGDEVIVPAYTYIATAMAVTSVGAIPVVAEVDETLTLDPADTEKKITKNTKAVIPVDILGLPCDMDAIMSVGRRHGVYIVEDACQANGASYKGRRLGTIGDAGAYSYNAFKLIGAGEGGCMVTDIKEVFERALIYHDSSAIAYFGDQLRGVDEEQFCGNEYRVSEITGAIMREQLKKLDGILDDLKKNRDYILSAVGGKAGLVPLNDSDGNAATNICLTFPSAEEAGRFKDKFISLAPPTGVMRPIETGKHVYSNWTPIMRKRGALNPKMDPFLMEANKGLRHDYSPDDCARSLDIMSRAVCIDNDPDFGAEKLDLIARAIIEALD